MEWNQRILTDDSLVGHCRGPNQMNRDRVLLISLIQGLNLLPEKTGVIIQWLYLTIRLRQSYQTKEYLYIFLIFIFFPLYIFWIYATHLPEAKSVWVFQGTSSLSLHKCNVGLLTGRVVGGRPCSILLHNWTLHPGRVIRLC